MVHFKDKPAVTTPTRDAELWAHDDPAGTPADKKLTVANLIKQPFGGIYVVSGVASQSLVAASGFTDVTQFTANGPADRVTVAHGTDSLTIMTGMGGTYEVRYACHFVGVPFVTYELIVRKDGVEIGGTRTIVEIQGGASYGFASAEFPIACDPGQVLKLAAAVSADATFAVKHGSLFCKCIS